jgi:hypothetical protein
MKSSLVIFAILAFSFSAQAQLNKNTWLVGGSATFNASKEGYVSYIAPNSNGYTNNMNLNFSSNIGYFIADKFAIGLRPYFSWGKSQFHPDDPLSSGGKSDSKRYGIGPFIRYYFLDMEKQYNILSEISYQKGVWKASGATGDLSNFNVSAGPVIFFNSSVGLEFLIGYSASSEEIKGYSKNSPKGFTVNVGFQIHLLK